MKSIIIYDSITGNTKKVAEVIAKTLKCELIHIDKISEYKIEKYDLVILGSPVHGGMPTRKIKKFLLKKRIKKSYALFCTYGLWFFGNILAKNCLNYIDKIINLNLIGKFRCPGFHQIVKMYKGRPNKNDLEKAKEFAEKLIQNKNGRKNEIN
jgi:flavodoxin